MKAVPKRELWLDNVRAVACLMVLIVHVTAIYKYSFSWLDSAYWNLTVFLDSASRMCVPLFFMVSGVIFLSDKQIKIKNAFKIFTALTFYSLVSVMYYVIFTEKDLLNSVSSLYSKPAMYHLWFMFYLFTFYIVFSLIRIRELDSKAALVIIFLLFTVFNYKFNDITLFFGVDIKNGFYIKADYFHLFLYTVAGAYIARINKNKKYFVSALLVSVFSVFAITVMTIIKSSQANKFEPIFQAYTSVLVFFSAISMFYVIRFLEINGKIASCSKLIARNSLAIYGIHAVILEVIINKKIFLSKNPALNMLFTYIIVIGISLVFAVLVKKLDKRGYVS